MQGSEIDPEVVRNQWGKVGFFKKIGVKTAGQAFEGEKADKQKH